jgi:Straboviridae major head protein
MEKKKNIKEMNETEIKELKEAVTKTEGAKPIAAHDQELFETLLNNQIDGYLKETTFSGDQAFVGSLILPTFRRSFTNTFMRNLVGVQPMTRSNGYVFSMRYNYDGNSSQKGDLYGSAYTRIGGGYTENDYNGDYSVTLSDFIREQKANSAIVFFSSVSTRRTATNSVDVEAGAEAFGTGTGDLTGFKIIYTEGEKALVLEDASGATIASLKALAGSSGTDLLSVHDNEAGYNIILKGYTGPFTTATGEVLGMKIPEMGVSIDKHSVDAKTRKMKSRFTIESEQDFKNNHGLNLRAEMIKILQYEIAQSEDRELLSAVNSAAAYNPNSIPDYDVSTAADGRWQNEKFRASYTEILRQSNNIAKSTFRSPGNFIIATPDVVTMMESMASFNTAPVQGTVDSGLPVSDPGKALAGSLGGRFVVYRDIFQDLGGDYATVGLKGTSNLESGIFSCPYINFMSKLVTDQESGNPSVIAMRRAAILANPMGAENYYSTIAFSNIFQK